MPTIPHEPDSSGGDDDASWLLADYVPNPMPRTSPVVPDASPDQEPFGWERGADIPNASFDQVAVPIDIPHQSRNVTASATAEISSIAPGKVPRAWLAVGDAFQPLAGGPLFVRVNDSQPAAMAVADPGGTVHAVIGGVVHRSGTGLELRAPDGRVVGYRGTAAVNWTTGDGEAVPAGAALGWVSATTPAEHPATMVIYLLQADGVAVDPVGWLAGLADPRELGIAGGIAGGIDPFVTDLRLAGHLDGGAR